MNRCVAPHPDIANVWCDKEGEGPRANHEEHTALSNTQWVDWHNEDYKAPPKRKTQRRESGGKFNKNKGILKQMANKIKDEPKEVRHYIPTDIDARGRVALYLLKYLAEWISLEELEIKDIGGSAASAKCQELINIGWPVVSRKVEGTTRYMLTEDPRKPLWKAV